MNSVFSQMFERFTVPSNAILHDPVEAQKAPTGADTKASFTKPALFTQLAEPVHVPSAPQLNKTRWDLDADQYERFEERTCIMHYDGGLPWHEAERLALEEVLAFDPEQYLRDLQAALEARR